MKSIDQSNTTMHIDKNMKDMFKVLLVFMLLPQLAATHDDDWTTIDDDVSSTPGYPIIVSPSDHPSSQPVVTPQGRVGRSFCRVSDSGFYGDESISNLKTKYIRYEYQMEYKKLGDLDSILDSLEDAISNSILKSTSLFGNCGIKGSRKLRRREQQMSSERTIVGISSKPKDIVTSDDCPFDPLYDNSECVVIDGILSIFYGESNANNNLQNAVTEVQNAIEEGMGDGSLSLASDDIIELDYISNLLGGEFETGGAGRGAESDPSESSNTLHTTNMYLIFATGGASIMLIFLTMWKWWSTRHNQISSSNDVEDERETVSSVGIDNLLEDDASTNFISSKDASEISLFRKWKMSPEGR